MKFWMHGLFGAVLAGGIWISLWQIIVTMALIVTTGAALTLQEACAITRSAGFDLTDAIADHAYARAQRLDPHGHVSVQSFRMALNGEV